MKLNLTEKIFK